MAGVIAALQEISGAFCNQTGRFQAEITGEICNQPLQKQAEISCNRAAHTESSDFKGAPKASCENVLRSLTTPELTTSPTQIDEAVDRCPFCGSEFGAMPTLRKPGERECWTCNATWIEEG